MVVGRFMKKKSNKKTDEEVLAGFGAEHESSEEDFKVNKTPKVAEEPAKKSIGGGLKNKFGKILKGATGLGYVYLTYSVAVDMCDIGALITDTR